MEKLLNHTFSNYKENLLDLLKNLTPFTSILQLLYKVL